MPVRQSIRLSQILVLELLLDFLEKTRPNGCSNQHHRVRQTPAGFAIRPISWDRCLVWSLGKESKRQKQFIRSKMARFGVNSLANVIAIYFKLVSKWPQLDTVMTRSYACLNSVNGESLIRRTLSSRRFWWIYLARVLYVWLQPWGGVKWGHTCNHAGCGDTQEDHLGTGTCWCHEPSGDEPGGTK